MYLYIKKFIDLSKIQFISMFLFWNILYFERLYQLIVPYILF